MSAPSRIKIGSWTASPALNLLESGDRSVKLESRTMDVLAYLAARAGEVVSVEDLLAAVWQGVVVGEGSAYHAIKQLRQALGADYIETIPKRGYRLTVPVEALLPEEAPRTLADPAGATHTPRRPPATAKWLAAAAVLAVVAIAAVVGRWSAPRGSAGLTARFTIAVPDLAFAPSSVTVSPDGRYVAYVAGPSPDRTLLHVRALDALETRVLAGTEGATMPFWSTDGTEIGFRAGSELKRVALVGGQPRRIADLGWTPQGTATWNSSGDILVDGGTGLMRVPADGGEPTRATTLAAGEGAHALPQFLPGGHSFLFTSPFKEPTGIFVQSLASSRRVQVAPVAGLAAYASGYLLVNQVDGSLTAQPFDVERLEPLGEPVRLAEDVAGFSVSDNGVLAYVGGMAALFRPPTPSSQLAWYDRAGRRLGSVGEPGPYFGFALSPDGRFVAVHRHEAVEVGDIAVLDVEHGGAATRRTLNRAHNLVPRWSPDGSRILYTGADFNLYQTSATGSGPEQLVLDSLRFAFASGWSPDGKTVLIMHIPPASNQTDVAALALDDGTVTPLMSGRFQEAGARFSPNGRFIVYNSDESGRFEVYVRAYPRAEGQTRVSTGGGLAPQWSRDGRELFFLAPDGTLMAANVEAGERSVTVETPRALFKADWAQDSHPTVLGAMYHSPFDVGPDGERFLVNERIAAASPAPPRSGIGLGGGVRAAEIQVVVDWTAGLDR